MLYLRTLALLLAAGLVGTPASAQTDLATTADGQQIFFSAPWRLPGSADQPPWPTIFRYAAGTWTAHVHSDAVNNIEAFAPFVSGDGSIVGWETGPFYFYGSCRPCIPRTASQLTGIDMSSVKITPYRLTISPNGRYLATPGFLGDFANLPPAVQDLTTGQVWTPDQQSALSFSQSRFQVANDGTLVGLMVDSTSLPVQPLVLGRWRPGSVTKDVLPAQSIFGYSVSADGQSAAVLMQQPGGAIQAQWVDLESGNAQVLFSQDPPANWFTNGATSISVDGSRVIFIFPADQGAQPPVYFWDRATGMISSPAGLPEGAGTAVISGNGAVALVVTNTNRLLRFDLNQGGFEEILSAFPASLYEDNPALRVPGSAVRFLGYPPFPGEHFVAGDLEFPILPIEQNDTLLQVPFELATRLGSPGYTLPQLLLRKDGYPFELPLSFGATNTVTPLLERAGGSLKALPTDFSHLIDKDHPAIAGQTIVTWLTGLGPLDQPVATGTPGPFNPSAHPLAHLECGLVSLSGGPSWQGLELPFIGYAPGLVGVYQVNVNIPAGWPSGNSLLDCYSGAQKSVVQLPILSAN